MASVDIERSHVQSSSKSSRSTAKGLRIDPLFCPPEVADPAETVEWELRSCGDQGREWRGAVRAAELRDPEGLESAGDERGRKQVLLRRGRHAAA